MITQPKEYAFLNQLTINHQDVKAEEVTRRIPIKGNMFDQDRQVQDKKYIKAELVRRNLLSRKDLMNLYKPPIMSYNIPANNPFYNKSLIHANASNYGTQPRSGTTQSPRTN